MSQDKQKKKENMERQQQMLSGAREGQGGRDITGSGLNYQR